MTYFTRFATAFFLKCRLWLKGRIVREYIWGENSLQIECILKKYTYFYVDI